MTWLGIVFVILYIVAIVHNLIRIGQGGYTFVWTPGALVFTTLLQVAVLTALLYVGTGYGVL